MESNNVKNISAYFSIIVTKYYVKYEDELLCIYWYILFKIKFFLYKNRINFSQILLKFW